MSLPSPLLGVTLDAIDRLDQAALKRQAEALVAQAVPAATPVQIQAVVQASLDQMPLPVAPVAAPKGPVDFGWKRPRSLVECKHKQQSGWWHRQSSRIWGQAAGVILILGIVAGGFGSGIYLGALVGQALGDNIGALLGFFVTMLLVSSVLIAGPVIALISLDERLSPERFKVAKKSWSQPVEHYLRYPETREFMRAVLSSAVPEFLVGDVEVLEQRYLKASASDRAVKAAEDELAKKLAIEQAKQYQANRIEDERQQEEREHQARLAAIAQALQ